jgi:mercuric reductase
MLLEVASEYYHANHPRFQAIRHNHVATFDFGAAIKEKGDIVASLRESNYIRVAQGLGVPVIEGRATFISPKQVQVDGKILEAEKLIIATGSSPQVVPFPGIEEAGYITNREALSLERLPRSMVIIGGGPLALEFAQIYSRFGTRVTLLQRGRLLLSREEPEVSQEIRRCLEEEGVEIRTEVSVQLLRREGRLRVVEAQVDGRAQSFQGEELLLATGVVGNSGDLGLDMAGVMSERSFIRVDPYLQTTVPHIYGAGDVVGKMLLETVAAKEGYVAASNALEGAKKSIDYDSIPRAVFTDPQVASVGLTETELMKREGVCSCRTVRIEQVPKARAIKENRGLVKMVVNPKTGFIVGVHMVAPMAADLIHEATLAVKYKLTVDDLIDTVHVFPTLSEAIKLVAQSFRRDVSRMSCCVE